MAEEPVIFRGSRFLFWTLGPCLLLFIVVLAVLWRDWTSKGGVITALLMVTAFLLFLKLYDAHRFHWAGRVVAGMVFLAYVSYFVDEVITSPHPFRWPARRSDSSAINALFGLVIFGLPGLCYALFSRTTWRRDSESSTDGGDHRSPDQ